MKTCVLNDMKIMARVGGRWHQRKLSVARANGCSPRLGRVGN